MDILKQHPFAIEAHFDYSLVLTFAFPKAELENLIPKPLVLDCYEDKWAFVAVAMVQTKDLRLKGFPKWTGRDFFLIGYRIFVQYKTAAGKRLRGLYILKSETDSTLMTKMGNLMTHYGYEKIDISFQENEESILVQSKASDIKVDINHIQMDLSLPTGSPFPDWKTARRFAGPLPFTFYVDAQAGTISIVEGIRNNWIPQPVEVKTWEFGFLKQRNLDHGQLANAFIIRDIPYSWKKGRRENWK
ncbi:DUF2071 domain-containing protein [Sphingobacterium kyonggiense]